MSAFSATTGYPVHHSQNQTFQSSMQTSFPKSTYPIQQTQQVQQAQQTQQVQTQQGQQAQIEAQMPPLPYLQFSPNSENHSNTLNTPWLQASQAQPSSQAKQSQQSQQLRPEDIQSVHPTQPCMAPMTDNLLFDDRDLGSIGRFYNKQYVQTPLTDLFFQPSNIMALRDQLEIYLAKIVHQEATQGQIAPSQVNVHVPINSEFAQSMYNIASRNLGFAYTGPWGLQQLNQMFLESEARIQYYSLRVQAYYKKLFIAQDRIRVFPYGEPTRITRGEVTISSSGRSLADPKRSQYQNFLTDVLRIKVDPETTYPVPLTCQRQD